MSSKLEATKNLDAFGLFLLSVLGALAVAAGYSALHFGWFGSPWEFAAWLFVCGGVLVVGLPNQNAPQATVAHSKWAERADIEKAGIGEEDNPEVDQGIYLGQFKDEAGSGGLIHLFYKGIKHLICFGPTSSGKSMSIIVPNAQNARRSMIIIDPKGDVTAISARRRKAPTPANPKGIGEKVIVLNPFGLFTKKRPYMKSAGWNPLKQIKTDSPNFASHAMCVADAIVEKSSGNQGENAGFFERSALNLMQALIMWECLSNPENPNLRNIPILLTARDTTDPVTKELTGGLIFTLQRMAACDNYVVQNMANGILERFDKDREARSIRDGMETLKSHLTFINDQRIAEDMAIGGAIDFGALHRKITTIYLILPTGELSDQAKWLRMFINLALRNLYESQPTEDKPPTLPPVLFMLDEFGNLGRLQEVVKALNMARSARVQLMFFLQNIGQLTGPYKQELGSFFSGAGATVAFKTGALDIETTEHLAKAFGNQEMRIQTETQGGGSVRPEAIPLIRAEDISRLEAGTTINLIEPCPWPVKALVPVYAKTKFNEGLDPNPTYFG
jgi:type IV secretion system protein VirD4